MSLIHAIAALACVSAIAIGCGSPTTHKPKPKQTGDPPARNPPAAAARRDAGATPATTLPTAKPKAGERSHPNDAFCQRLAARRGPSIRTAGVVPALLQRYDGVNLGRNGKRCVDGKYKACLAVAADAEYDDVESWVAEACRLAPGAACRALGKRADKIKAKLARRVENYDGMHMANELRIHEQARDWRGHCDTRSPDYCCWVADIFIHGTEGASSPSIDVMHGLCRKGHWAVCTNLVAANEDGEQLVLVAGELEAERITRDVFELSAKALDRCAMGTDKAACGFAAEVASVLWAGPSPRVVKLWATLVPVVCKSGDRKACKNAKQALRKHKQRQPTPSADTDSREELLTKCLEGRYSDDCLELAGLPGNEASVTRRALTKAAEISRHMCDPVGTAECLTIGRLRLHGCGTAPDRVAAIARFREACKAKNQDACLELGLLYEKAIVKHHCDASGDKTSRTCQRLAELHRIAPEFGADKWLKETAAASIDPDKASSQCAAGDPHACFSVVGTQYARNGEKDTPSLATVKTTLARAKKLLDERCSAGDILDCMTKARLMLTSVDEERGFGAWPIYTKACADSPAACTGLSAP